MAAIFKFVHAYERIVKCLLTFLLVGQITAHSVCQSWSHYFYMYWPLAEQSSFDDTHILRPSACPNCFINGSLNVNVTMLAEHKLQTALGLPEYFLSRNENYLGESMRKARANDFIHSYMNFRSDGLTHMSRLSLSKLLILDSNHVVSDGSNCLSVSTYRALTKHRTNSNSAERYKAGLRKLLESFSSLVMRTNVSLGLTQFQTTVSQLFVLLGSTSFLRDAWPSREADLRLLDKGFLPIALFPLVELKRLICEIETSMRSFVLQSTACRDNSAIKDISVSVARHNSEIMVKLNFPVELPVFIHRRRNRPPGYSVTTDSISSSLVSGNPNEQVTSIAYEGTNDTFDIVHVSSLDTARFCFIALATFVNTSYWLFTHTLAVIVIISLLRDPSWLFVTPGLLAHIPSARAHPIDDFVENSFDNVNVMAIEVLAKTLFMILVLYLIFSRAAKCVFLTQHFGFDHEHIYDSAGSLGKLKLYISFVYKVHSAEGLAQQQITFWTFVDGFVGYRDPSEVRLAGPCQHTYTICRDSQGDLCFVLLSELMAELHHDSQVIFDKPISVCVKLRHLTWLGNNSPIGLEKGVFGVASVRLLTYKNSYYNTRHSLFYDFPVKNMSNMSVRSRSDTRMDETSFTAGPSSEG